MSDAALEQALVRMLAHHELHPDHGLEALLEAEDAGLHDALRARWRALQEVGAVLRRPDPQPRIPGYTVKEELGRGALGVVHAAWDETLQREVALKVLRSPVQRVVEEARRAAALRHPSIVTVHSVAEGEGVTAIVMERVDGRPLDRAAEGASWRARARLLAATARAVATAHAAGIVHRDLKPDNVLVTDEGEPKVLDFGLALDGARDEEGVFRGTPAYASPEQAAGERVAAASDVFSFGSVMYRVLTGALPFDGDDVSDTLRRVREAEPVFPRLVERGVPEGLQAICLACLARDPERRPGMERVAADLARWLAGDRVRLRPAIYGDVLGRQLLRQMADVIDWQRQGIVSSVEGDSLRSVLRRILADEDQWILDARRLSLPQVLVNAGAWLIVVAMALVVWLGRDSLDGAARWLVPTAGTASLAGLGVCFHLRREVETAAPFLAAAVLSCAPTVLCLQAELGWNTTPTAVGQLLGESYSNQQLLVALVSAGLLSALSLAALRFTALSWTTALLAAASWWSWRCVEGWLDLEPHDQAVWCLPLSALFVVGLLFEHRGRVRWSTPFHWIAAAALVLAGDVIALDGPTLDLLAWFPEQDEARRAAWSVALNGVVFLACTLALERCPSLDLRRGSRAFELLVPLHFLGGFYAAAREPGAWLDLGLYAGAVLSVLLLGAFREHRRLLYGGLIGLALASHLPISLGLLQPVPYLLWLAGGGALLALGARAWMGR